jgi:hypothetical protein
MCALRSQLRATADIPEPTTTAGSEWSPSPEATSASTRRRGSFQVRGGKLTKVNYPTGLRFRGESL